MDNDKAGSFFWDTVYTYCTTRHYATAARTSRTSSAQQHWDVKNYHKTAELSTLTVTISSRTT